MSESVGVGSGVSSDIEFLNAEVFSVLNNCPLDREIYLI